MLNTVVTTPIMLTGNVKKPKMNSVACWDYTHELNTVSQYHIQIFRNPLRSRIRVFHNLQKCMAIGHEFY